MKTKFYLTILCTCGLISLSSCNGTQQKQPSTMETVPTEIQNAITQKYPSAAIVSTEKESNGTEVEIKDKDKKKEVWFDQAYQWVSTHWDLKADEVPPAIMNALTTSAYASYKIDDIEAIENPQGLFYNFELTKENNTVHITFDQFAQIVEQKVTK